MAQEGVAELKFIRSMIPGLGVSIDYKASPYRLKYAFGRLVHLFRAAISSSNEPNDIVKLRLVGTDLDGYSIRVGKPADYLVVDCKSGVANVLPTRSIMYRKCIPSR